MNINIIQDYLLPFGYFMRGIPYYSLLRQYEESQFYSPEKIEQLQKEKLQKLLLHSYKNVPYYREVFKERNLKPEHITSSRDLEKLPILTKEIIRTKQKDLIAQNIPPRKLSKQHTGGSTGEPLSFYIDKRMIGQLLGQPFTEAMVGLDLAWIKNLQFLKEDLLVLEKTLSITSLRID